MMESSLNQAFDAFRIEAESLAETAKVLDREEMRKAVEALAKAERIAAVERTYASDNYFNDATIKTILGIDEARENGNETV